MKIYSLQQFNGLYTLSVTEEVDGTILKYAVAHHYNLATNKLETIYTSFNVGEKEVPQHTKEKLKALLDTVSKEW